MNQSRIRPNQVSKCVVGEPFFTNTGGNGKNLHASWKGWQDLREAFKCNGCTARSLTPHQIYVHELKEEQKDIKRQRTKNKKLHNINHDTKRNTHFLHYAFLFLYSFWTTGYSRLFVLFWKAINLPISLIRKLCRCPLNPIIFERSHSPWRAFVQLGFGIFFLSEVTLMIRTSRLQRLTQQIGHDHTHFT